jgi:hypothetical protein
MFSAAIALICLAIGLLVWPNNRRRVQRQLEALAEVASCPGQPKAASRNDVIREAVFANFAESAVVDVQDVVNSSFDRDQLIQQLHDICGALTQLHLQLNQVSVDIAPNEATAQAQADVVVQYEAENRHYAERRRVDITLRRERQAYRITAVRISASIVNQPEPRP